MGDGGTDVGVSMERAGVAGVMRSNTDGGATLCIELKGGGSEPSPSPSSSSMGAPAGLSMGAPAGLSMGAPAGLLIGAGVFVIGSQIINQSDLFPQKFTPEFNFAMNDAKRPLVYLGSVYDLADNQTLRFGVQETLKDASDDFTIAAEWRLRL